MKYFFLLPIFFIAGFARAQGMDWDTALTDAPAAPPTSAIRIGGFGIAQTQQDQSQGRVAGQVMWTPLDGLAVDAGAYYQSGRGGGPSARARYQILSQAGVTGVDLSAGMRFKMIGFHPGQSEIEMLVAAGKSFGSFDFVLNGVLGVETEGGGKDVEVKSFAGWRFGESFRAGLDLRLASELEDEEVLLAPKIGREFDLTVGPAASCVVSDNFVVQAMAGLAMPRASDTIGAAALLGASVQF